MPENALTDVELSVKFHELADGPLGARGSALEQVIRALPESDHASTLLDGLLRAPC